MSQKILDSVGIDKAYLAKAKKKQHIQSRVNNSIFLIRNGVKNNLEQKGYIFRDSNRLLSDLNPELENEKLMAEVIQLASGYQKIESPLRGEVTPNLQGEKSQSQTFDLEEVFSDGESENIFVKKALEYASKYPTKGDTLMFLHVQSFVGKRLLGFGVTGKSTVTFKIVLLSLKWEKVIFSFQRTYEKTDLLTTKKMMRGLEAILDNIPVR